MLSGQYEPYEESVCAQLEAAYQADPDGDVRVVVRGDKYVVSFPAMKQCLASDQTRTRPVRRTVAASPPAASSSAAVGTVGAAAPSAAAAAGSADSAAVGTKRPAMARGRKFLSVSKQKTGPAPGGPIAAPPAPPFKVELVNDEKGAPVVVLRCAAGPGGANRALREALQLGDFPKAGSPFGRQGEGGHVPFPQVGGKDSQLMHEETRAALRAAAETLGASGYAGVAAELGELAEADYTRVTGALLYDEGAKLGEHLDDIKACNANPFDARTVLWSFGSDVRFKLAIPRPDSVRRRPRATRSYSPGRRLREVTLHHGDALVLNVERIVHGVTVVVGDDEDATGGLLPKRRACVAVRPALTASSPNAGDYT